MEFTIKANGIRLNVESDFDLDLSFVPTFLDSLVPTFEFYFDDEQEEEDEISFDDDGVAWWYDEENDELYYCEGDIDNEDDWVLVEE
jgi:hypothetical protein